MTSLISGYGGSGSTGASAGYLGSQASTLNYTDPNAAATDAEKMRKKQQAEFEAQRAMQQQQDVAGLYAAMNQQRMGLARRRGRASTILTAPAGSY